MFFSIHHCNLICPLLRLPLKQHLHRLTLDFPFRRFVEFLHQSRTFPITHHLQFFYLSPRLPHRATYQFYILPSQTFHIFAIKQFPVVFHFNSQHPRLLHSQQQLESIRATVLFAYSPFHSSQFPTDFRLFILVIFEADREIASAVLLAPVETLLPIAGLAHRFVRLDSQFFKSHRPAQPDAQRHIAMKQPHRSFQLLVSPAVASQTYHHLPLYRQSTDHHLPTRHQDRAGADLQPLGQRLHPRAHFLLKLRAPPLTPKLTSSSFP